jgi:hypothetical protein
MLMLVSSAVAMNPGFVTITPSSTLTGSRSAGPKAPKYHHIPELQDCRIAFRL